MLSGQGSDAIEAAEGRVAFWLAHDDPGPYATPVPFNVALRRESGGARMAQSRTSQVFEFSVLICHVENIYVRP